MPDHTQATKKSEWWIDDNDVGEQPLFRYRTLWTGIVVSTCLVALLPLFVMVAAYYVQYEKAFVDEVKHPIKLLAVSARRSLLYYLEERTILLDFIVRDLSQAELLDQARMARLFGNLRENQSGFVDIGLIDDQGVQRSYIGPYDLLGRSYADQPWFQETLFEGHSISEVFSGYRRFPHFTLAVRRVGENGKPYLLRATLNTTMLDEIRDQTEERSTRDTFIINRDGILQTPSKRFGQVLSASGFSPPPDLTDLLVKEEAGPSGRTRVVAYAPITGSPFTYVVVEERDDLLVSLFTLRKKLLWFLAGSVVIILVVVFSAATMMVNRLREADDKRLNMLHKIEYTAKMASIGRLAAGVAHEINNPLAIINEKAGLLKDYVTLSTAIAEKDRFLRHVEPIISSVERCAKITRRLLRFAKHIDVHREPINLEALLREVVGFMEKEAAYRGLGIAFHIGEDLPVIESDRGRLQQVFLNIINNAFGAVKDGGHVDISMQREDEGFVSICIEDDGVGIPKEHLKSIFEPFFTTKEKHGTGLGLSITYGIVEKLGGKIHVESEHGKWTRFTVLLPLTAPQSTDGNHE
ncbi:MAG: hypothetical protein A2284_13800 [Deltaproteobacteria bacterium RIFOXYA12_FULL_61_11]|nr:MAG: hypothetical protein A2284_13800 [Deltaproteobacteria bacterium RIFOXYA12_FULL_61_11]